jgi:hypothetical protein
MTTSTTKPVGSAAPSGAAPPKWNRHSTVVIMAVDEADKAVVKKGPMSNAIVHGNSSSHLSHETSLFHIHRSSALPGEHKDEEFSVDHIDYWTLRFKHREEVGHATTAPSGSTSKRDSVTSGSKRRVDRTLEGGFLADFFDRHWPRVQKGILTAVIIWALYVINDVDKNNDGLRNNYHETLIIRFVNCGIGLLCAAALWTPFIQKRKLLMPVVGFAMITFGVAQIVFGMWDENELDVS